MSALIFFPAVPFPQDFYTNFTTLEICDVTPESFCVDDLSDDDDDDDMTKEDEVVASRHAQVHQWVSTLHEGAWVKGHTAGGCRNYLGR